MPKAIIIGAGPAGISAALYIKRAGMDVTVISSKGGALLKAEHIENYYGFPEGISGAQLYENGIMSAKRLNADFVEGEAVSLSYDGKFLVRAAGREYPADAVLLATGASRLAPPVSGISEFEGRGVSYCAVCDGFFFRSKAVGVLGSGEYALNEVKELLPLAASVTVFTNGEQPAVKFPAEVGVVTEKIKCLGGDDILRFAELENGEKVGINGMFIAYKTAGSTALARKIGAAADSGRIKVDENMQTSVKGLYAAGDCTGGLLQISKAVYEGAKAGTEIIKYLKNL